ncbi:tail tubular protein A [uncultured phage_MedDCM-OCT-S31-C1]|uniref:Tail tubular protein A n=1 Tax=uncultured phage_MedDCM-OCT-S31-C1 TaxID=2740800 RepID=A0A6S4PAS9_9CAUD|nr:tail protein [uncultured phage_MedDCM-OCT-S31-C1]BAQ94400.1 tail tubular protein A [uncultured phage_MedDCM-OCT-S31-C1]
MPFVNQSKLPGRTTLLDAVNICLENIGEQPVDSLNNQQIQDAKMAERTILEFHKEGQCCGWTWNTEYGVSFKPDATTKQVLVPPNAVEFSINQYQWNGRFQARGSKVYDFANKTYLIDPDEIPEIRADVIWLLSWDESPETFNRWSTIRAARVFSDRALGSEALFKYTSKDEADAKAEVEKMELAQNHANILTGGMAQFPTYLPGQGLVNRRVSGGLAWF